MPPLPPAGTSECSPEDAFWDQASGFSLPVLSMADAPEFADCKTLAIFCMKSNSVNGNVVVISDILRNFTAIIFKIYSRISSSKSTLLSTRQKLWLLTNYPMSMGRLCSTSASNPLPCRR